MSDVIQIDTSKWPPREVYIQKCDRCGGTLGSFYVTGVCYDCIVKLIHESADCAPQD
jgi:hypothetical protein